MTEAVDRLAESDRDLVRSALVAAVEGPYFPDWEIGTLLALDRDELRAVLAAWPAATAVVTWEADAERVQFVAVNNVLNNLIGYPHGEWKRLSSELGADAEDLVRLLGAWRGDSPAGYFDAIE